MVCRDRGRYPQKSSEGASLWEEQAWLDCLITKYPPEVALARAGRFIHHILSEHRAVKRVGSKTGFCVRWNRSG
jgi:hypothetical protein